MQKGPDNLNNPRGTGGGNCSLCRDLLICMDRFFDMLETAHNAHTSVWLTVDDVAKELKVSKSIVYRLIRHGELEAVNIVETNGEIAKKGHYRVKKSALNRYLETKKVRPFPNQVNRISCSRRFPKVKNHLGL